MGIFLQIVLAVVLVLAAVALIAFFWLRRRFRTFVAGMAEVTNMVDPRFMRPARIRLVADASPPTHEGFAALWQQFHDIGFRRLGDYREASGALRAARTACLREEGLALCLIETSEAELHATVFAVTRENHLIACGSGPQETLRTARMNWHVDASLTPEERVAWVRGQVAEMELRIPDRAMVRAAFEQACAVLADAEIAAGPPDRAEVEAFLRTRAVEATDAQIGDVVDLSARYWRVRMEEAALHHWRRASRIDSMDWECLDGDIHVVDDRLSSDGVRQMLADDEESDRLIDQFEAQGLSGLSLYRAVQARLPPSRRRRRLGEVRRPVHAVLFAAADESVEEPAGRAAPHIFEATAEDGSQVRGSVLALDSGDAKRQIAAMGLEDAVVTMEPMAGVDNALLVDPQMGEIAARVMRESMARSLLRALWSAAWIWLPPALLLTWTLRTAAPWSWGDYLIIAYALAAVSALLVLVAPMVLYHQLIRARLLGRWRSAAICLAVLTRIDLLGSFGKAQAAAERCKLLAARGRLDAALAAWRVLESELDEEQYLNELAAIHDAAGDTEGMIAVQQRALDRAGVKDMHRVDLALSLVRFRGAADEAEDLLSRVSIDNLSELVLAGYHYVRGLILAARGQHESAVAQFRQAVDKVAALQVNPAIGPFIAEINGYTALSLKRLGQVEKADSLWRSVLPVLEASASSRSLVQAYREAG